MADDGLFLNFAPSETVTPIISQAAKFKGGSWRERLRLKKNAKNRGHDDAKENGLHASNAAYIRATKGSQYASIGNSEEIRPTKRRRQDGQFVPSTNTVPQRSNNENTAPRKLGGREVISSLFSYNPVPTTTEEQAILDESAQVATKPSNAPLPDGIDSFTSMGLSTTLAAHLLTKMGLKNPTAIQKAVINQALKEDSDIFIQSETGSGKTLAYLLPVVQRIMNMTEQTRSTEDQGSENGLNRDSGLFAIILAPTRELCKQISVVLERLLGCAHFIVAGTVLGGEKKKSEKARLRKGLNILVATPGRLVDHLENTKSLDVSNVRYLVLDEGDRLMDLGFEEDITKIVKALDGKKRKSVRMGLPESRITMLCSATLKMNVQKLGDISLKDAILVKGEGSSTEAAEGGADGSDSAFLAPAQLKQSYIVAAAKLRLVTLTALLRRTFARKGSVMKAIVFISCADSVDFHFKSLTRQEGIQDLVTGTATTLQAEAASDGESKAKMTPESISEAVSAAPLLSSAENPLTVYKLHGSLPQGTRTAIVKAFASSSQASLLIATDVASRGLDLPNLDLVIEYDPAFSTDEHLHRIGRTARLGRDGRAIIFLLPGKEENYIEVLKQSFRKDVVESSSSSSLISNVTSQTATEVLKKGFSPATGLVSTTVAKEWEGKATEYQLDVERWVLSNANVKEAARRAFTSHIRAYATHVASERQYFDIKELHLGHLAKAFGLRDAPGKVNVAGLRSGNNANKAGKTKKSIGGTVGTATDGDGNRVGADATAAKQELQTARNAKADIDEIRDADDAAKKMKDMVRNRKRMMGAGADEFNIA